MGRNKAVWVSVFIVGLGGVAGGGSSWAGGLDDGKRCKTEAENHNYDLALHYCTRAIQSGELSEENLAATFTNRGVVYDEKGDYDRAIADYDQALRLKPDSAFAFRSRGNAYFDQGQFTRAFQDFAQAKELTPSDLYILLRLYLARSRGGTDGREILARHVAGLDLKAWPGPVVTFYLGQSTPQALLAATADTNSKTQRERECEAHFYLGEYQLLQGATAEARRHFQAALDTGVTTFAEYRSAQSELSRLPR